MACRGRCIKESNILKNCYKKGYVRCTTCDKSIKTKDKRCYCCNYVLRRGAQSAKYRSIRIELCARIE